MGPADYREPLRHVLIFCSAIGLVAAGLVGIADIEPAGASSSWTIVTSPNPGSASAELVGVSCRADDNCMAVGSNQTTGKALTEHWNGIEWSIVASPSPGPGSAELDSVACPGTTSCFAVGRHGSTSRTLTEHWNGTKWSIIASPNPGGAIYSALSGVTCRTTSSCFAVGFSEGDRGTTLTEYWNGTKWKIVASPNPDRGGADLTSVACPTARSCFAAGNSGFGRGSMGRHPPLTEHWNGTKWSIVAGPRNGYATLNGVACANTNRCFAVANSFTASIEHWDGAKWSIIASPNVGEDLLLGIACRSTNNCFAVGLSIGNSANTTLTEHWNGSNWSIVASPNVGDNSHLESVSCPTTSVCVAVGRYSDTDTHTKTLIESYS